MWWRALDDLRGWDEKGGGPITAKQKRMLNAVCNDLSEQITWHGIRLGKDQWRWLLSAVELRATLSPGWDYADGNPAGFIMIGRSSLELSRSQAAEAISRAVHLGDCPESQDLKCKPVNWSDKVLFGLGYRESDIRLLKGES